MISRNQENERDGSSPSHLKSKEVNAPVPDSPILSQIKQVNPYTYKNTSVASLKSYLPDDSSTDDVFYEASPLLNYEYLHFSALIPSISILEDSIYSTVITNSTCKMEKPLIVDNSPFNLRKTTIAKSNRVVPFSFQELSQDEINLLSILTDELNPIDQIEHERLINEKLKDLGYDEPSFWQWSNPRDYFFARPWAKYLANLDQSLDDDDTDYEFDLDDVYADAYCV